jgi:ABC-2 type transport system ATP-binding protein
MRVAEEMCDFVFMIYRGRKVLDGTLDSIRKAHGRDVLRVRLRDAQPGAFEGLPGVDEVTDLGNLHELHTTPAADSQAILAMLATRGRVERFEVASPSLQDIFVRIASPEQEAMATMG